MEGFSKHWEQNPGTSQLFHHVPGYLQNEIFSFTMPLAIAVELKHMDGQMTTWDFMFVQSLNVPQISTAEGNQSLLRSSFSLLV